MTRALKPLVPSRSSQEMRHIHWPQQWSRLRLWQTLPGKFISWYFLNPNYKAWRQENSTMALPALSGPSSHDGFPRRHQQQCIWELLQTQMFASPQKLRFASFITPFKRHLPQMPSLAVAKIAISQSLLTSCPSCLSFSCIIYWHKMTQNTFNFFILLHWLPFPWECNKTRLSAHIALLYLNVYNIN